MGRKPLRRIEIDGVSKSVRAWAEDPECSVSYQTIYNRLDAGVSPYEAVFGPALRGAPSHKDSSLHTVEASTKGAKRVVSWCESENVNLHDVAIALEVSYSTVLNLINGKSVSYSMVLKAAMLMHVDCIELAKDFKLRTRFEVRK